MHIIMHVCCGPCALFPLRRLREMGHEVEGFFYNPNIHPYREFKRRLGALRVVGAEKNFPIRIIGEYGLKEYLRRVVFHEQSRCEICVDMRLAQTVATAKSLGAPAFTTSLLYSKYQNHKYIKKKCEELAQLHDLAFVYEDFRQGWQQGIDESLALDLYRQPYCGCVYSEQERYDKKLRKKIKDKNIKEIQR